MTKFNIEIHDNDITQKGIAVIIAFYQTLSIDKLLLPDIYAFATGTSTKFDNVVIDVRINRAESSQQIVACSNFFDRHKVQWVWFVTPGSIANDLEQQGLSFLEEVPAMYFDLSQPIHLIQNNLITIQELSSDDDLKGWIQPINEGFKTNPEDDSYRQLNAKLLNNGCDRLKHFVGYHDGNIVSSGTLFFTNHSVMLHNLATKTAYTKRGFGTALTMHMMQYAKESGVQHCFLDSSEGGVNIYQRIGFKVYSTTIVYSKPV